MTRVDAGRFERRGLNSREPLSRTEGLLIVMFITLSAAILGAGALGYTSLSNQLLDMQQQIGGLRSEVHEEIGGLRSEVHEEIGKLRAEMREEIGKLRSEMHEEIGGLRQEIRQEIGKLSERIARIETVLQIHHGPLPGPGWPAPAQRAAGKTPNAGMAPVSARSSRAGLCQAMSATGPLATDTTGPPTRVESRGRLLGAGLLVAGGRWEEAGEAAEESAAALLTESVAFGHGG